MPIDPKTDYLGAAIENLEAPIKAFLETGLFFTPSWRSSVITPVQVRKVARKVAAQHKRPFIVLEEWTNSYGTFAGAIFRMPKSQYLVGHIAPLLLAEGQDCRPNHGESYFCYRIGHADLWAKMKQVWLTDPDMRKARRVPSL